MWSAMMLILTNSYTDLMYSFLMTEPSPNVPSDFSSILYSDINLYTIHNDGIQTAIQEYKQKFKITKTNRIYIITGFHDDRMFDGVVIMKMRDKGTFRTKLPAKFVVIQDIMDLEMISILIKNYHQKVDVRNEDFVRNLQFGNRNIIAL